MAQTKIEKKITFNEYKCTACGKSWPTPDRHFCKSNSQLYSGNNGYINICFDCLNEYYKRVVNVFSGDEEKAIRYMGRSFEWEIDEKALGIACKSTMDKPKISIYISRRTCTSDDKDKGTYLDTVRDAEQKSIEIEAEKEAENYVPEVEFNRRESEERWGLGIFKEEEMRILDTHYLMLKECNPNCDSNQEIFIKDLCYIKLQQMLSLKEKRIDDFQKTTKEYRDTFKQAGLKTVKDQEKNDDDCWGKFVYMVSRYTPEEYYKDKTLYKDFDGIGELFQRFVLRPMKNLMTGSHDRDPEYCVDKDNGEDDGEE